MRLVGLAVWIAAMIWLPAPLAARVTLLGPLVIVPALLTTVPAIALTRRLAPWPAFLAALPLVVSFALPSGPLAAACVVPWVAICVALATAAAWSGLGRLPELLIPARAAELGAHVAPGFLAVGAIFLGADRLGVRPLGFSAEIVLLTATHFHLAGFGMLLLGCLLARRLRWLAFAIIGLIAGIPVTASGFLVASNELNAVGASMVGLSGIGIAMAYLLGPASGLDRIVRGVVGAALLVGMLMGIAWSWSVLLGFAFVDLDTMVRTHGLLNAGALLLATLVLGKSLP